MPQGRVQGATTFFNRRRKGRMDVLSSVTRAKNSVDLSMPYRGTKTGRGSPKKLDPRIIPDERWPGMFRLLLPDGSLTDMLNLTRAKDALAAIRDEGAA
jgi:hypothetical protein